MHPKVSKGNELPSGQSPKASFRSEAEADRSESPLVAREGETPPWIKDYPFLIRYLLHVFPATTRGLSDRPLDPFGVPSVVACPNNKQRKNLLNKNPPSPSGLGVMGQGPNKTTCIRRFPKGDRKALWSPVRAKPHLAQKIVPFLCLYLQRPFAG